MAGYCISDIGKTASRIRISSLSKATPDPYLFDEVDDNNIGAVVCSYFSLAKIEGL